MKDHDEVERRTALERTIRLANAKARWGCPIEIKLIPFVVQVACANWSILTGR